MAYELLLSEAIGVDLNESHHSHEWLDEQALLEMPDVHPFVKAYFKERTPSAAR